MATVSVRLPGIPPFVLHVHEKPDRFISGQLRQFGQWEPFETRVALALLEPGDTFVDLGANLGYYSVLAALRVGPRGRVFAFEPDPDNFALLERNLAANRIGHARAERCAVSDHTGSAQLHLNTDNLGDHRLFDSGDGRESSPVTTTSLDEYFSDPARFPDGTGVLDLVKMDTQGCEALILRGAKKLLAGASLPKAWIVEFWPFGLARAGTSAEELLERLAQMHVDLTILREDENRALPTSFDELAEFARHGLHPDTQRFANLLAIPRGDQTRWVRAMSVTG